MIFTPPDRPAHVSPCDDAPATAGHITGEHLLVDGGYVHLDRSLP